MRSAVSAVTDRRPRTMSLIRRGETPIARAKRDPLILQFVEDLCQMFSGVDGVAHDSSSVVVGDFDFSGTTVCPAEADAPLVVDADAVLPLTVTAQRLEAVGRRQPQVGQRRGRDHALKSHTRPVLNLSRESGNQPPLEDALRGGVP